jgi:hypothetical protein
MFIALIRFFSDFLRVSVASGSVFDLLLSDVLRVCVANWFYFYLRGKNEVL